MIQVQNGTPAPAASAVSRPSYHAFGVPYNAASNRAQAAAEVGWTTILCETFEGPWPNGSWATFDANGATGGSVCWGTDDFQPYRSARSAWPGKGCADGVDPTDYLYGPNWDSWMVVGPFTLAGADAAEARFRLWYQMVGRFVNGQVDGDYLFWGASTDGVNFYGPTVTGGSTTDQPPTDLGWLDIAFDLTNVPTLGSLVGQPRVWMAWRFVSDDS